MKHNLGKYSIGFKFQGCGWKPAEYKVRKYKVIRLGCVISIFTLVLEALHPYPPLESLNDEPRAVKKVWIMEPTFASSIPHSVSTARCLGGFCPFHMSGIVCPPATQPWNIHYSSPDPQAYYRPHCLRTREQIINSHIIFIDLIAMYQNTEFV